MQFRLFRTTCGLLLLFSLIGCIRECPRAPLQGIPHCAIEKSLRENNANLIEEPLFRDWWNLFGDEQLSKLVDLSLKNHPSLWIAQVKINSAMQRANIIRASLFPYVSYNGDVQRQRLSKTGLAGPNNATGQSSQPLGPAGSLPFSFTQWETYLNLSYEIDLWGRIRNSLKAALGEAQALIADEAFKTLTLSIAVTQTYFQLQVDYRRWQLAQELLTNREEYLQLIDARTKANLENRLVVNSIQNEVDSARNHFFQIENDLELHKHQLQAYLGGNFDEDIFALRVLEQPLPKIPFPTELPLHLVAHRPDLMAKLWLVQSTRDLVKVAQAGFYPDINLMGFVGFQTIHPGQLLRWASIYGNIEPAFSLPLFDGGRLIANLRDRESQYDLAIYQYNEAVLEAIQEVLDGITSLDKAYKQLDTMTNQTYSSLSSRDLTNLRITHNINSGLDGLNSERDLLIARDQQILAWQNTVQKMLLLVKSIGGGYDARE